MVDLFTYTDEEIAQGNISIPTEDCIGLLIKQCLPEEITCGTNSTSANVPNENCVCVHSYALSLDSFCTCGFID